MRHNANNILIVKHRVNEKGADAKNREQGVVALLMYMSLHQVNENRDLTCQTLEF